MAMTKATLLQVQVTPGLRVESCLVAATVLVMARGITNRQVFVSTTGE